MCNNKLHYYSSVDDLFDDKIYINNISSTHKQNQKNTSTPPKKYIKTSKKEQNIYLVDNIKYYIDYNLLIKVTKQILHNLNNIIDKNYYPVKEAKLSNKRHRPIGIGVQGLQDVFFMLKIPFESEEAFLINKRLFECIYYGALEMSIELGERDGTYMSYKNGPLEKGILQFDYYHPEFKKWKEENEKVEKDLGDELKEKNKIIKEEEIEDIKENNKARQEKNENKEILKDNIESVKENVENTENNKKRLENIENNIKPKISLKENIRKNTENISKGKLLKLDERGYDTILDKEYLNLDWNTLRQSLSQHGLRNSLLISPMPTASTSQILGYNECIEPITSNIYSRRTLAGEFQIINKYLLKDLIDLKIWNVSLKNTIIEKEGNIGSISIIPKNLREIYKSCWEMKMKNIINMAASRQMFIDQSQSLNLFVAEPTYQKITSMHFYSWKKGLKTGMYYLRTVPIASAIKVTVDREMVMREKESMEEEEEDQVEGQVCNMEEGCMSCSG